MSYYDELRDIEAGAREQGESDARAAYGDPGDYNMDGEDPAPTALLRCRYCPREIAFYGDVPEHHLPLTLTLESDEYYTCACGATFGEGDALEIIDEGEC